MREYFSDSPQETVNIAAHLADTLKSGDVIAFTGDLGAGKTCFTKGLASGLGYKGMVTSPTFALINEYVGGRLPIYHFDMYRVASYDDLYSTGYFDYENSGGILVVEWSENISEVLPDNTIYINIENLGENKRKIVITGISPDISAEADL